MPLFNVGNDHHAFFIGRLSDQLHALIDEHLRIHQLELGFAALAVGQQVHRQIEDLVEVAIDDPPSLAGLNEIVALETHLHHIGPSAKGLENVLDRMRQRRGGFTDGGESLGGKAGLIKLGVLDGHARLQRRWPSAGEADRANRCNSSPSCRCR